MIISYDILDNEAAWRDETEAPATAAFNARLRTRYGLSRSEGGSKGDNNHLKGRHRSRRWALESAYCTDRTYGTRDARDRTGDGDWLRATDIGISGAEHHAVSRRLDAAVRAGQLPELAEWFGSFDGSTVVGWFEGHTSSSDDSHLFHIHIGWWTQYADDAGFFDRLYEILTGDDMSEEDVITGASKLFDLGAARTPGTGRNFAQDFDRMVQNALGGQLSALSSKLDGQATVIHALADAVNAGGGNIDTAAILARIDDRAAEDAARDAAHAAEVEQLQDEIADLRKKLAAAAHAEADALDAAPAGS